MKKWIMPIFLLAFGITFLVAASPGDKTELILNREYFEVAHKEMENAKESIHLVMYLFLLYDHNPKAYPNHILEDLINAHNRGVKVQVLLDYPKPRYTPKKGPQNKQAHKRLKEAGVPVRYDSPRTTTHSKVLIIDGETVILGSHNYTDSGTKYNNETSLLIRDKDIARELIDYIDEIK